MVSSKCTSYRNTARYDVPNVKMYGHNRCKSKKLVQRRNGVWYTASGKKYRPRNKNYPGPYAKISRL